MRLTEAVKNGKQLTHTELRELRRLNRAALELGRKPKSKHPSLLILRRIYGLLAAPSHALVIRPLS